MTELIDKQGNKLVRVVDNYFPKFITDLVHTDLEMMPVAYTNSPYRHFHKSRFFGTMLYHEDKFADIPYYWFVDYFNRCIMGDVCKDLNITIRPSLNDTLCSLSSSLTTTVSPELPCPMYIIER